MKLTYTHGVVLPYDMTWSQMINSMDGVYILKLVGYYFIMKDGVPWFYYEDRKLAVNPNSSWNNDRYHKTYCYHSEIPDGVTYDRTKY
jgi:hypothetical protein